MVGLDSAIARAILGHFESGTRAFILRKRSLFCLKARISASLSHELSPHHLSRKSNRTVLGLKAKKLQPSCGGPKRRFEMRA
jgi:hypothetical protein